MGTPVTDGFDVGDDEKVISILNKWKGGPISDKLFTELAGILPQPCIETVILRENNQEIEVLLIPRPSDDISWNGMLHSPGGALRHSDFMRADKTPINGVFERIQNKETKLNFSEEPIFVTNLQHMTKRGPEAVMVYLAKMSDSAKFPDEFVWVNINKLESLPNFPKHQLTVIQKAVEKFKEVNK